MNAIEYVLSVITAFIITFLVMPIWIRRKQDHRIVGKDVHKKNKPMITEQGGIIVSLGVTVSILLFVALTVFVYKQNHDISLILAALTSFLIATFIGFLDGVLGWRQGLRQLHKIFLSLLIPLPLMAVNAGTHYMTFPYFGQVELGLLYPLLVIPLGVVGASNGFNMLAGYNGLEAGLGTIIIATLSFVAWKQDSFVAALLGLVVIAALLAFLYFNIRPSRVFPGDSLTYSVGTMIATIAIYANIEFFAIILFIPYFFEFLLKARAKFTPGTGLRWMSIARVLPDGTLAAPKKWCTLPHFAIAALRARTGKATEAQTVMIILGLELFIAVGVIIAMLIRTRII